MAVLAAFDLYRFFHTRESETLALRGVSLRLNEGELVALVGPSGSGKSTLLACLSGLDEPDGGLCRTARGAFDAPHRGRTRAPQRRKHRHPHAVRQSVPFALRADNIELAMSIAGKMDNDRAKNLLAEVGLADRAAARPGQLSGGELARAGLAVALAAAPRILLADEPTGEVDAVTERSILDLLSEQCRAGVAVLVATHSQALAARADRIIRTRLFELAVRFAPPTTTGHSRFCAPISDFLRCRVFDGSVQARGSMTVSRLPWSFRHRAPTIGRRRADSGSRDRDRSDESELRTDQARVRIEL